MNKEQLTYLIKQFREGTITKKELDLLKIYIKTDQSSEDFLEEIFDDLFETKNNNVVPTMVSERIFAKIENETSLITKPIKRNRIIKYWYVGAAAAAILLCALTLLYNRGDKDWGGVSENESVAYQIMPGSSKAVVLLEDGKVIDLENIPVDSTLVLAGYTMKKEKDGLLTYALLEDNVGDKKVFNTLITPRGGEYGVNLPDGTQVFLNASSKLKYPLKFDRSGRELELEGEAFFDVQKAIVGDSRVPFSVSTGEQKLEVLGTVFNVNSYGPNIQTTLVEGAVKLAYQSNKNHYLKPNQQANYNKAKNDVKIHEVDPFYTIAWKTGVFAFEDVELTTVMETLARWYDLDIEYVSNVQDIRFTGTISRYENIDKVLELIELTRSLNFKIEGRRVFVMS